MHAQHTNTVANETVPSLRAHMRGHAHTRAHAHAHTEVNVRGCNKGESLERMLYRRGCLVCSSDHLLHTREHKRTVAVTKARALSAGAVALLLYRCCRCGVYRVSADAFEVSRKCGCISFCPPAQQHPINWPALEIMSSFLFVRGQRETWHTRTLTQAPSVAVTKPRA